MRCQFNGVVQWDLGSSGLLVEGCVFYNSQNFNSAATYQNLLFQNNYFFFAVCCLGQHFNGLTNSVNVRFDHNLFTSNNNAGGGTVSMFNTTCRFLTFTNNIFNQANVGSNVSFSTFNNNITNNITLNSSNAAANATPWAVNSNVDGGGNVAKSKSADDCANAGQQRLGRPHDRLYYCNRSGKQLRQRWKRYGSPVRFKRQPQLDEQSQRSGATHLQHEHHNSVCCSWWNDLCDCRRTQEQLK